MPAPSCRNGHSSIQLMHPRRAVEFPKTQSLRRALCAMASASRLDPTQLLISRLSPNPSRTATPTGYLRASCHPEDAEQIQRQWLAQTSSSSTSGTLAQFNSVGPRSVPDMRRIDPGMSTRARDLRPWPQFGSADGKCGKHGISSDAGLARLGAELRLVRPPSPERGTEHRLLAAGPRETAAGVAFARA